jgi:AraC-like DNA-binding protein
MSNTAAWGDALFSHSGRTPFRFLAGMRVRMEGKGYCAPHHHKGMEVVYHHKGSGHTRLPSGNRNFAAGSVVIYGPAQEHDQTADTACEDLCVQIGVPPALGRKCLGALYVPSVASQWAREDLRALSSASPAENTRKQHILNLRATALTLHLLQLASEAHEETVVPRPALLVRRAAQYMEEHLASLQTLGDVAVHLSVSYDYLRHIFKSETGQSLVQYLTALKIQRAKVLLRSSPLPLKQIATDCGFRDEFYFSAVFRRLAAEPPGAFRARGGDAPAVKRIRA